MGPETARVCSSVPVIDRPRSTTSRPGSLWSVEAVVVEVGVVHDLGDAPQHRIGDVVPAQDGLEGAVTAVVAEFDAAHVERGRVGGHLGRVRDEQEFSISVEEPADQPGAGGPVDVHTGAGGPSHGADSTTPPARRLAETPPSLARSRRAAAAASRSGGGKKSRLLIARHSVRRRRRACPAPRFPPGPLDGTARRGPDTPAPARRPSRWRAHAPEPAWSAGRSILRRSRPPRRRRQPAIPAVPASGRRPATPPGRRKAGRRPAV